MTYSESETTENKQSWNEWREVAETVATLATSRGGVIRIGVDPSGQPVGVQLGGRSLEQLADQIKSNTDPPQFPSIEIEGSEERAILLVRVEESPIKPVWAFGRPLKRVGRSTQRLSPEETIRLHEQTTGRSWDTLPCPRLHTADLQRDLVERFLRRASLDLSMTTGTVLENLELIKADGLANAAALLFTGKPQRYFLSAFLQCGRFLGTTSVQFIDEQTVEGDVITQIEQAIAFVKRNTRQQIRITGQPHHEVVPEYPNGAIREAITNAVCHRDYTSSGTVQVRIYDDRLEVWNPGLLPPDLSIDELYREHKSRPRNRLLASAMHRAQYIERWGTGTLRIIQECAAAGLPAPEFVSEAGTFRVIFRNETGGVMAAIPLDLADRRQRALAHLRRKGTITSAEYRTLTGVSSSQAAVDLAAMIEAGLVVREGKGPRTRYLLAPDDQPA